jgi:hypothetical protein
VNLSGSPSKGGNETRPRLMAGSVSREELFEGHLAPPSCVPQTLAGRPTTFAPPHEPYVLRGHPSNSTNRCLADRPSGRPETVHDAKTSKPILIEHLRSSRRLLVL